MGQKNIIAEKSKEKIFLIMIFGTAFVLRYLLAFLPSFLIDMNVWLAWAERLQESGFGNFYHPAIWTHYTPFYLYFLWFLGKIKNFFLLENQQLVFQLFKLPAVVSDVVSALLIYKILKKQKIKKAKLGAIFYLFNPALIFNSAVWGQIDSLLILFFLFAYYYLFIKKKFKLSAIFLSFSFLLKPQAIFFLPVIIIALIKNFPRKIYFHYFLIFFICAWLLALPFFPQNPFFGLPALISKMASDYPVTTAGAFNFWQLLGNWQSDNLKTGILTAQQWGLLVFSIFSLLIVLPIRKKRNLRSKSFFYLAGLFWFNFFLFLTRVHERYLLPALALFLILSFLEAKLIFFINYSLLSLIHFFNLMFVFWQYYPYLKPYAVLKGLFSLPKISFYLSLASIFLFFIYLFFWLKKKKVKIKMKMKINYWLFLLLFVSFLLRFWRFWEPQTYVFDEVYHGFTAQEIAKGNKKAWEWWNPSPQGFAYEWTHPYLAKVIMAGSIILLGKNDSVSQWAFRLPAIFFGLGAIYLTYLLGKKIFRDEKIGLLAGFLLSFENLSFTMSRTAMLDIYFLFFMLATIYLAWKKKYFFSGIFLGLACATKWTGFYILPAIGVISIGRITKDWQKSFSLVVKSFLNYGIIPLLIYLLCHFLFFASGHNLNQFIELNRQMWYYHTHLKATHSYQSSAWSWPLLLRPVWFWVEYQTDKIGNIYNLGNPFIFWSGFLILPFAIYQAIKKIINRNDYRLGLIIFLYFIFWLPWVFSPRIMFLHHYLPALPFLCLLLAWSLKKIYNLQVAIYQWRIKGKQVFIFYCLAVVLCFFFFYPLNTGILLPKKILDFFFWLPSWR